MCGLAGIVNLNGDKIDRSVLSCMKDSIKHRGPDSGGLYVLDNYGLFRVGQYVRVTGTLDPDCTTICQQGDGCILNNSISFCFSWPGVPVLY